MSRPFRGLSDPQMTFLRPDIVLMEQSDPGAQDAKMSTNSYALLKPGKALLLDLSSSTLIPFVRQLHSKGFSPVGVMISHRHVVDFDDSIGTIATEFKIPVLLHPIDAGHPQALGANILFENPVDHPILREFGIQTLFFPGHTEGHVIFYSHNQGGLLLTGDAAMGTTADQAEEGLDRLIRPPIDFNVDHAQLREQWLAFDFNLPFSTVLPFHGTGYIDRRKEDLDTIMRTLIRREPTEGLLR